MLEAGTKLGRYEIRTKIGAGGMGEVYCAQETKLHKANEEPRLSISCFARSNFHLL